MEAIVDKWENLKTFICRGSWLSDGLKVPIDSRHKIAKLGDALKRRPARGRRRGNVHLAIYW